MIYVIKQTAKFDPCYQHVIFYAFSHLANDYIFDYIVCFLYSIIVLLL